jgi:hypothetical protein
LGARSFRIMASGNRAISGGSHAPTFRLVLAKGSAGASYHRVADEGVQVPDIADVISQGLNVPVVAKSPEEAIEHFGFLGHFLGVDLPASIAVTRERMVWHPLPPCLIPDLDHDRYSED